MLIFTGAPLFFLFTFGDSRRLQKLQFFRRQHIFQSMVKNWNCRPFRMFFVIQSGEKISCLTVVWNILNGLQVQVCCCCLNQSYTSLNHNKTRSSKVVFPAPSRLPPFFLLFANYHLGSSDNELPVRHPIFTEQRILNLLLNLQLFQRFN